MSQKYLLRSLLSATVFFLFFSCSTGEVPLESTEFQFTALETNLEVKKLDDFYDQSDLLILNQVLTSEEKEKIYDKGYFIFTDKREVSLITQRPFVSYKNWLMPTIPGRQVPGVISQLSYEFSGGRELAVFIVTLNDQVDIRDVAQRSEMIDKLYLSISGSAILIVSSDDEEYTDVLQRRIRDWKSLDVDGGDYTLYSSNVRDWKFKYKRQDKEGLSRISGESFQKEKMGMNK